MLCCFKKAEWPVGPGGASGLRSTSRSHRRCSLGSRPSSDPKPTSLSPLQCPAFTMVDVSAVLPGSGPQLLVASALGGGAGDNLVWGTGSL